MNKGEKMNFKVGDRIELIQMGPDPDPVEPGARGTIDHIGTFQGHTQIGVDWDNGRALLVILPEDTIRKINDKD